MKKVEKKIVTSKIQEVTVYSTADGTEFESESEAKKYEFSLRHSILNSLSGWINLDSIEGGGDDGYEVTFFSTKGKKMKSAILLELTGVDLDDLSESWKVERVKKFKEIIERGETFMICRNSDYSDYWIRSISLESHIEELKNLLNLSKKSKK